MKWLRTNIGNTTYAQRRSTACRVVWMVVLAGCAWLANSGPVLADGNGTFPLPELTGTITIDDEDAAATCSDGEWPAGTGDFLEIDLMPVTGGPAGNGKILIHRPDDPLVDQELYLFLSIIDNDSDLDIVTGHVDSVTVMFDLSHDHVVDAALTFNDSDDRGIRFRRNGDVARVFGDFGNVTIDPTMVADDQTCISDVVDTQWAVEARLTPGDIGLNSFNALMGAAVIADDNSTGISNLSSWPAGAAAAPSSWANIITRPPIDFILLVDQSGSMFGDKWESAKQAVNNFRSVLGALLDDALAGEFTLLGVDGGGDRLGMAVFTTAVVGNAEETDPLNAISLQPIDYAGEELLTDPGGGTPMSAGVNQTLAMFQGAAPVLGDPALTDPANVFRQMVVMMLSDGKHNTPSTILDFDTEGADFDYLPAIPNCPAQLAVDSLVRINTVAIGTDATVDVTKLDDIKDCFSGDRYTNVYSVADADAEILTAQLTSFYFATIFPYYHLNLVNDTGANFSVNAGERRLLLFAFWPDTIVGTSLSITEPDMSVNSGSTCPIGLGYCYLVIDNPQPGSYTNFNAPLAAGEFVLLDLNTEARFGVDNQPHGTSSTITLRGRLLEAGQPITGADVRAQVARPEEGFGTFASTHSVDGCEQIKPSLPAIDFDLPGRLGRQRTFLLTPAAATAASATQSGDTNPPAFALMESLLKGCGKEGLDRATDSGLELFDDGTHGDETADDGFYTLVFDNTGIQGSYIFRFTADGTASDGRPFTRVQEVGEYIRLDVDPAATAVGSRDIQQFDNLVIREYNLLPMDGGGQFLGPGHADQIAFFATGGQWRGPVLDYNNGYYARVLSFDPSRGEPVVTPVVQGKPILPPKDLREHMLWWMWLIIVIVLLTIILLLWLKLWRSSSP